MSFATVAAFWAVSFLLVLTPGADWGYVISAGLRGKRLVLPATAGLAPRPVADTAAVLTYIRQSWGQRAPGVTALDVQKER